MDQPKKYDVVVIGLGAVGSAALFQLSKAPGIRALGIDRYDPPHGMGSSHGESRITRLAVGEGEDYIALAKRSHEIWREIEAESGRTLLTRTSGILLDSGVQAWEKHGTAGFWQQTVSFAEGHGIGHELLDPRDLRDRYPAFMLERSGKVYLEHEAGYLRPELCIQSQLELAAQNGAEIRRNCPVLQVRSEGESINVATDGGRFLADRVLLSAGGWIGDFLPASEKKNYKICRQVLHWLEIGEGAGEWTRYPVWMWGFGPRPEDFLYGFPSLDGRTVKMATESFVDAGHPDALIREVTEAEQKLFWKEKVEGRIAGLRPVFARSEVCFYTVTSDARFVTKAMEGMENVLLVSACSGHGFKHSAALGERIAKQLLQGR
ncbi:N-methyl-L-tryptophan oxidase [Algoriphagus sp. H41]|uniref:N-methyl-L-tryptophan oxidase n=1 Tax=Algoriphagus oliviformis TaxID=2811231 RepID=A0ABS3BYK1_9BACT|nr:N-methyl-L-tryptophan oxidase [Algoriphagus oliviformis]MBN7809937.1 N-methyl-L-tryptophan oxidase [Algoriphagus oliviformis]